MTETKITYHTISDDWISEFSTTLDSLAQETGDAYLVEYIQEAREELAYLQYHYGLVDN